MALTKVNNDLQDALAAAQPTITSVGTLTGLTVGGTLSSGDITIAVDDTPTLNFKKASSADVLASINVTTDAGSGGKLAIQTKRNGNTPVDRLTIDDDGRVTMPSQPAFSVTKSATQSNISISNDVVITWDTESYDVGSNFASNTFTAPVTGKYQLSMLIRINLDSAATYYRTGFDTSNRSYRFIFDPDFGQDLTFYSIALSELVDMDANDTAIINIRQVNGSAISDINGNGSYARFTGYLAC